jgi:hypothetical protein
MTFQSQVSQDNADDVKNTVNGWVQQRKWPALFRQKPLNIQLISMVNSVPELTGELLGLGQSLLKSRSNPASAIIRRTSEKAKLVRPFTLCLRSGLVFNRSAKKNIEDKSDRAKMKGKILPFQTKLSQTKLSQAADMIVDIGEYFSGSPLLAVTDSWFGNAGLLKPVRKVLGERFDILSCLRCNNILYDFPEPSKPGQRGRRKK